MSPFYDLPDELLIMIITMLVTSCNGAADLARLSATCTKFRAFAENSAILKVVNFDGIHFDDFNAHHHMKDLLLLCARARNVAAESRVAKVDRDFVTTFDSREYEALLHNDNFFWTIILNHDQSLLVANPQATGILCNRKLIRSFICHASYKELSRMRFRLFNYTVKFLGYNEPHGNDYLRAIFKMTNYFLSWRDTFIDVSDIHENEYAENERVLSPTTPRDFEQNRALVLTLYDQILSRVMSD